MAEPKEYVKVVLADTKGPFSKLIKLNTWSQWSHAALMVSDTEISEATFIGGVHRSSFEALKDRSHKGVILKVPVWSQKEVLDLEKKIITSTPRIPYDLKGALGLALHRDWQENDSFWCSEWVYYLLHNTNNKYLRGDSLNRIVPEHFWMLNFDVLGTF